MKASEILAPDQGMELERILDDVTGLETVLKGLPKVTAANESQASELLSRCRARLADLEKMRTALKAPVLESGRRIDAFFKETTTPIKALEAHIAKLIGDYLTEVRQAEERRRREEERQLAEERARQIEAQRPLAEAVGVEPEELVPSVTKVEARAPEPVRTTTGTVSGRRDLVVTIDDPAKLPREFLIPDEQAITRAAKEIDRELIAAGEPFETVISTVAKAIPGVTVAERVSPVTRRHA